MLLSLVYFVLRLKGAQTLIFAGQELNRGFLHEHNDGGDGLDQEVIPHDVYPK
jgi:hypothetical protein